VGNINAACGIEEKDYFQAAPKAGGAAVIKKILDNIESRRCGLIFLA
jgi:hypothetical protein